MTTVLSPWSQPHSFRTKVKEFEGIEKYNITLLNGVEGDRFGNSVSMNSDGDILLIGSPGRTMNGSSGAGAVYSYVRNSLGWVLDEILFPESVVPGYGNDVSISSDGNTCVVAAEYGRGYFIYHRVAGSWQPAFVSITGGAYGPGHSCSMSRDGKHCIVGTYATLYSTPAVTVLKRTGDEWSVKVTIPGEQENSTTDSAYGQEVAISGDGKTFSIANLGYGETAKSGYYNYNDSYVKTYDNTGDSPVLISTLSNIYPGMGQGLSLNEDGQFLISAGGTSSIRVNMDHLQGGAGRVYKRSGGSWGSQFRTNDSAMAVSCQVNGAANFAVLGTPFLPSGGGCLFLKRSGNIWSEPISLIGSDTVQNDKFGQSVAINERGNIVAIGASRKSVSGSRNGSVYIFE